MEDSQGNELMDRLNGWQRLWILLKWLAAISAFVLVPQYVPIPDFNDPASPHPTNGQMAFAMLVVALFAGTAMFMLLSALEWVYRGFRPAANDLMEANHAHTLPYGPELGKTPVAALGQHQPSRDDPTRPRGS